MYQFLCHILEINSYKNVSFFIIHLFYGNTILATGEINIFNIEHVVFHLEKTAIPIKNGGITRRQNPIIFQNRLVVGPGG